MKIFSRTNLFLFAIAVVTGLMAGSAQAADNLSDVSKHIVQSGAQLPWLLSGMAYMLGLLFAVTGIFKLRDHVERPSQVPLQDSIIRVLSGGALFSLPIVTTAVLETIGPNGGLNSFSLFGFVSSVFTALPAALTNNFNGLLTNILTSLQYVPYLLSALAYILALLFTVSAIIKAKEHVEEPSRIALREPVIRFLIAGALFALPLVMETVQTTIMGQNGASSTVTTDILTAISGLFGGANCDPANMITALGPLASWLAAPTNTLGNSICGTMAASTVLPAFMTGLAYLFGIILVIWGLLKIKDHVLNPSQTPLWDGAIRLIAAGAFFALPYMASVMKTTIATFLPWMTTTFNGTTSSGGLDSMMTGFAADVYGPMMFVMNFFGYIAGTALVMVGISRLLKSSQEGPRGPGGLGTMITFLAGGALLSISPLMGAFSTTLFSGSPMTMTYATVTYGGMSTTEIQHVEAMISAILQFMIILGFISFARGIFIIRSVSEGNHQASMIAGMTHMIGGALAVNLGPLLNVLQNTFGITAYGITFT